MSLLAIQIDQREPKLIRELTFGGVPKTISELSAGDVWALCDDGQLLAVERKTPGDLLHTLRDQRLFPQLARLRELTTWAYLVITGDLHASANNKAWVSEASALGYRETGWDWPAIQGALLTIQELGVHVVTANGDLDFEGTILRLANRDRSAVKITPARETAPLSEAEAILTAFPQIGMVTARALMAGSPNLAWALDWLTSLGGPQGVPIPGVGPGTRQRVRQALGLADDEILGVQVSNATPAANNTSECLVCGKPATHAVTDGRYGLCKTCFADASGRTEPAKEEITA